MITSRPAYGDTPSQFTLAADGELRLKISDEADRMVLHEFIRALDAKIPDRPKSLRGNVSKDAHGNLRVRLTSGNGRQNGKRKPKAKHSRHTYIVSTGELLSTFEAVEA